LEVVLPVAAFLALVVLVWTLATPAGRSVHDRAREDNRRYYSQPGWWIPLGLIAAVFFVVTLATKGTSGAWLLGFAVFAAFFTGMALVATWWHRRR
jgi:hypothetical protein